ncbi:MAG: aminotransferase class V-fold PLP-dependent enzyme [Pseudomonadota bacterium]
MNQFALVDPGDLELLADTLTTLAEGHSTLPAVDVSSSDNVDPSVMHSVLQHIATLMHDNYPYAHPLYAGQMLKPPHPIARIAYQAAMWVNPNNHALDGGRASSAMEKEAVANIASMFGLDRYLGHLTSSGTLANLEALWVAREEHPGKLLVSSQDAHYTHSRLSAVLGIEHVAIATDSEGRIDIDALEALAIQGRIGTVVATAGTTSFGTVDPIRKIIALAATHGFRVHVDAAYGGYFRLATALNEQHQAEFLSISHADSIAIDPHKHGLQPYGCGCVLFADPDVGQHYQHDSPYTYFTSDELHLGEISLECSRAGAAAVALWATQQALPMTTDGQFAEGLNQSVTAAQDLYARLLKSDWFTPVQAPDLDIVVWVVNAPSASTASALAQTVFDIAADNDLHLALTTVSADRVPASLGFEQDGNVTCLRSCLMKPEHLEWMPEIWARLERATHEALR